MLCAAAALAAVAVAHGAARGPAPATAAAPTTATAGPTTTWAAAPPGARIAPDGWIAPLKSEPKPALPDSIPAGQVFVIPIHGAISESTADAVERKAIRCRTAGAKLVVFDMDTPGGLGSAMDKITQVITRELKSSYTVAYVDPEAISAGAIISLACDEIVLAPGARIGDAMPIMISPQGGIAPIPKAERGKIESYIRALVRGLAGRNGYSPVLCESMITLSMEVWLIRDPQTGQLKFLNIEKHPGYEPRTGDEYASKPKPALEKPWQYVRQIVGPSELLTMTTDEAVELGFGKHVFADMDALMGHYHVEGKPETLENTWSEHLVGFLTSPVVAGILVFIAIMGLYVELNTPGVGLPGAVALIAFALLIGSRYLTGLAQWWEIVIFVLGLILLFAEIFITPGFGVMGGLGILCLLVGLLAMIVPNAPDKLPLPTTSLDWHVFLSGLTALAVGFLAAIVGAIIAARFLPEVPVANRLILPPVQARADVPAGEAAPIRSIRPGQVGTVEGTCRPVGRVRFGEHLVDAVADGNFIPAGVEVRVIKNEGNRVVVTPVESEA